MVRRILVCGVTAVVCACGGDERDVAVRSQDEADSATRSAEPVVLFLGTSLTAGLGLAREQAYPSLIQAKIDSAGLGYRVVNAGLSGETSAGGLRRLDWLLRQPVAVLVVELGANDMLRGQSVEALRANLAAIIERTRAAHPEARIVLAGLKAAPNLGAAYAADFDSAFVEVAREYDAELIPFLLDGVAGLPELNQPDGKHPTAEGQRIVAENVWEVVEPILVELGWKRTEGVRGR